MPDRDWRAGGARLLTAPGRIWWGSLPVRVVGSTLVASALVIALGMFLLLQQATEGVLNGKRRSATAEASIAVDTAQRQLRAADAGTITVNDLLTQLTFEVANRGAVSGQYQIIVQGPVADIRSGRVLPESVPGSLREVVTRNAEIGRLWVTPTEVVYADGRPSEPGSPSVPISKRRLSRATRSI